MDIITTRRTKVEKGYKLLADITVELAATSVDITGLNIGKGDEVVLVSEYKNDIVSAGMQIFVNGNNTPTSYYVQALYATGTTCTAARYNSAHFQQAPAGGIGTGNTRIKLTNSGQFVCQSGTIFSQNPATGIKIEDWCITSTFTVSSITSLRLQTDWANSISIGSRFQLYRIGGA